MDTTTAIKNFTLSANFIKSKTSLQPKVVIVLGSGYSSFIDSVNIEKRIPYCDIPNFPVSTVKGHTGELVIGTLSGVELIIMNGRFHYYEGYDISEVVFPIRVLKLLGINTLILTNAAGGMNSSFSLGEIMLIEDHINLLPNPLIGANLDTFGDRFPDMSEPYSKRLLSLCENVAKKIALPVSKGVYIGVTGPTFETPAEYNFFRTIGADAVGMSTVPEVIIARHSGIEVLAVSIITDLAKKGIVEKVSHEMVLKVAAKGQAKVVHLLSELIKELK